MNGYQLYAIQGIAKDRADGSTTINFSTLELSPEDFLTVRECNKQGGTLLFAPDDAKVVEEVKGEKKPKSPSQLLRLAMMSWYGKKYGNCVEFQEFYENWTKKKIREFNESANKI